MDHLREKQQNMSKAHVSHMPNASFMMPVVIESPIQKVISHISENLINRVLSPNRCLFQFDFEENYCNLQNELSQMLIRAFPPVNIRF